jgi:hypothetical protein
MTSAMIRVRVQHIQVEGKILSWFASRVCIIVKHAFQRRIVSYAGQIISYRQMALVEIVVRLDMWHNDQPGLAKNASGNILSASAVMLQILISVRLVQQKNS